MIPRLFTALLLLLPVIGCADELGSAVLAEMNFARAQPQEYAQIIERNADRYRGPEGAKSVQEAIGFLRRARSLPPLSWSNGISRAALGHAQDVGSRGASGHTGIGGTTPWRRMARFGQYSGYAGENIDYGHNEARSIVISLIVDHGVPGRGHRANVFSRNFRVTGVAIAPHITYGSICVMDFATDFAENGEPRLTSRMGSGLRSQYMGNSFF